MSIATGIKAQNNFKAKGNVGDSKSLWNYSLAPGWSAGEVNVLKLAL